MEKKHNSLRGLSKKGGGFLKLYNKLPDDIFSEKFMYKILRDMGLHSYSARKNCLNMLESCGIIKEYHPKKLNQKSRNPQKKFYEKGKIKDIPVWAKGLIKEIEE